MARAPIREVSAPSPIRGIAAPVDTYVRPADPTPSPLHQLAEGLAAFDSGLGGFLQKRRKEKHDADYQKGLAEAYRDQGPALEEGVRRGLIPPQESPRFMEGLRAGQGNLAGIRLRSQFRREFLQWEGRSDGDPEAFGSFLRDFITRNVPENSDPHYLKGILPHIDTLTEESYGQFTKDTSTALYGEGLKTDSAALTEAIRAHEEDGETSPSGIDYEAIWTHALSIRDEALRRGTLHADIDGYLVETILLNAERASDDGLLALLDRTLPGQEHPLSFGLEVQKKRDTTADRIASAKARHEVDTAKQRKEAEEKLAGQVYAEIAAIWSKDIRENIPEAVVEDLSRIDPMARSKLVDLRKKMAEADGIEDKATIARIFADIHEGTASKRDIMAHFERGAIRSTETLNQALDRVDRIEKDHAQGTGILSDATLRKWHTLLESLTGSDPVNPFSGAGLTEEGLEAVHDMNMMVLEWEANNPDASFVERQEAINRIGNILRQRIELDPGMSTGGRYVRPPTQESAEAPVNAHPGMPSSAPASSSPPPEPTQPEHSEPEATRGLIPNPLESGRQLLETIFGDGETDEAPVTAQDPMPPLESLPEDQRQAITGIAERHGVDPEAAQRDIWTKVREIVEREGTAEAETDEPGIDPSITNAVPEDIRQRLADLLSSPPSLPEGAQDRIPAEPILALIGRTEGTDRGEGYNETLAYGAYTNGPVNLVGMTLDEVDALQSDMLRHPENSWNSSAIGRYQIVRTTLRSLRRELGLSGNERFDAAMQDRLAIALLERRGLSRWRSGDIGDREFLTSLAQEWASLPTPSGRGYYKGQRATATPKQVLKALHGGPPGHSSAKLAASSQQAPEGTPPAYSKIPDVDGSGRPGQVTKFMEWNSDPVANHAANLRSINPTLADVVRRAESLAGVRFVIGSGRRDAALQRKAVEWGWSRTHDSDHLDGNAVDLWPIDQDGAVNFDSKSQAEIVQAMKQAARELGVVLDIGADWKRFKDKPHFAIKTGPKGA